MLLLYYDGPCESTMISFSFRYLLIYAFLNSALEWH